MSSHNSSRQSRISISIFSILPAKSPNAIPLLMVHGWPGSFWDFSQVWGLLSNPSDKNAISFHVVAPSMLGFCWSDWPPHSGWALQDTARVIDQLMKRLG